MRVLDGRYGAYVTDGTTNATVPRGTDPTELTLPEAVALLRARAEMAPKKPKKAAKKTAKKAAKKTGQEGRQEGEQEDHEGPAAKKAAGARRRRSDIGVTTLGLG